MVLSGVSSGRMGHGIHGSGGCRALRFSRLVCNKVVVTAKIPLQTTHLLFSEVPFTESSGELCYF